MYVQSFGLKAVAVVFVRLTNSPAARGNLWRPISCFPPLLGRQERKDRGSWPMEPYNFWQDFFEAYRQSPDWIKLVWVVVPPVVRVAARVDGATPMVGGPRVVADGLLDRSP